MTIPNAPDRIYLQAGDDARDLTDDEIETIFQSVANDDPDVVVRFARAVLRAAQPAPGGEDRRDAAGQIEHLDAENHALREQVKALRREASTWNAALTSLAARMEILRQGHPRLEVRYWTGQWWEPLHGVRLDECLNAIAAMSPPPTSGTSRPFTPEEHAAWERENGVGEVAKEAD